MDRCSAPEMRKNLLVVDVYSKNGIDFVAIPSRDSLHKSELIAQASKALDDIEEALQEAGK